MSDTLKSIRFALATAVICSLLLTAAATGLQKRRVLNETVDRQKNILKSVGLLGLAEEAGTGRIQSLFKDKIHCLSVDAGGGLVAEEKDGADLKPVCLYSEKDALRAYIIPLNVKGLWGEIGGYIAINRDGKTVEGFTVYSHSETPGLGGEIEKPWFQENFHNKRIVDEKGRFVSISVIKGRVADVVKEDQRENAVDGISGATLTGRFLTSGMKTVLEEYEPLARRLRAGETLKNP